MAKDLHISVLLDFYARALTPKQREVIELYYNQDLSLAEITEHVGITRQGVRDSIKRGEAVLLGLEEKLGLAGWFSQIQISAAEIEQQASNIEYFNERGLYSRDIAESVRTIKEEIQKMQNTTEEETFGGLDTEPIENSDNEEEIED